jgi:hypothetical protein
VFITTCTDFYVGPVSQEKQKWYGNDVLSSTYAPFKEFLLPPGVRRKCREKVGPGTGRETGLGRARGRTPEVGASGVAGTVAVDDGVPIPAVKLC